MTTPAPVSYRHGGLVCTDHTLDVPLDHRTPDGPAIRLFAREVVAEGREHEDLPRLLWLQGGPGGRAERPNAAGAWLRRALADYRVVLLDQRGTGRSTPADRVTLARFGTDSEAAADHLAHFRADSIVRDAEHLRRHLQGDRPWSVLGQSFGGFSTLTYLSLAPEGLAQAYITGGLPTLTGHADDVYRAAYARTLAHNEHYFARYPGDQALADAVAAHLDTHDVRMPAGERLTVRRFQSLGITFGTAAKFDSLHYLLETAFTEGRDGPELTDTFLRGVDAAVSFAERPLYAALHEPIYAQGGCPTDWSAHRIRQEFPAFDATAGGPVRFTGEMVYPWQFEEDPALVPLRGAAEALAARTDWPALYDLDRLAANEVPVVAAVYHDDMYVDREHALATAGAVRGLRTWVTDAYAHDGVRADAAVLDRLIGMARGEA
ncbi:alpha/beta fold hydrolase [Streptomyces sp. P01-B04]|uniref:alpha/beta fold hydrolase n=1 Tax=Streptomyces poriferorum TaxID=2798799 RepID=UPI001C5F4E54|nr:alpha/beta fold hydrolase [Streptomyces poriferorum]MBW5253949.1 alpha/beta fold hydrolase [Streptomyces poriferorum]MBW5260495.1 alpha/beta fold hydrolase [Streptomyces poriferorum]